MKRQYRYFISFRFKNLFIEGYGNTIFRTFRKMDGDLIKEIQQNIVETEKVKQCIILHYNLMDQINLDDESTGDH